MKLLNVPQGSPEWLNARAKYRCASEAPIVMGAADDLMTRNELIYAKKTYKDREFSEFVESKIFGNGHEVEAAIRPMIEAGILKDLYPVVGVDDSDKYLASFDGMPMDEAMSWECKQWNEELAKLVQKGELTGKWYWQLEHQLLVSGVPFVKFTVSDGTPENTFSMDYYSFPARREQLIRGWDQFDIDVEAYVPVAPKAEVVAATAKTLPAITYKFNGMALATNLEQYKGAALQLVEESKKVLQTDQDFADREGLIKAFKAAEEKIKLVKEQVVGEIKDVAAFTNDLTDIGELIRQARLNSEKQITNRKEAIRIEIEQKAGQAFADHVAVINKRLGSVSKVQLPKIQANFFIVMKGKKSIVSLQNAVDTELARVKIEANAIAEKIDANLAVLREQAAEYKFLFSDVQQIVLKDKEDLESLIKARIAEHKEAERKKEEQIRQDERARAEREAEERRKQEAEKEKTPAPVAASEPAPEIKSESPTPQAEQPRPAAVTSSPAPARTSPAASQRPAAAVQTGQQKTAPRPTDAEILQLLMERYGADKPTVIGWLMDFQFKAVG